MLTNEQRAHDIAVAVASIQTEGKLNKTLKIQDGKVDFYHEYLTAYKMTLEALDRDYPLNDF